MSKENFVQGSSVHLLISKNSNKIFFPKIENSFEHTFFLRYGTILPKVLQVKIFLFLRKLNYVNLNLAKFQIQRKKATKRY